MSEDPEDPPVSLLAGTFPFVGKLPESAGKVKEFCAQAFEVGGEADQRAGLPAFLSRADRVFGSDVWVYLRNSGTLLHTHCLRGSATDPKARFDRCAKKAAGAIVGRTVGQS